jgi:hypothetical protein
VEAQACELLKLASDGPELMDRLDVLSMEYVPGKLRPQEFQLPA